MDRLAGLEALVAVVDTGSFSKAGERLGVAKSVVSRRVSQLEAQLGVRLLQRTTRSQALTAPGRELYERATRILAELDEAEQLVTDASAALRGVLRLAAPLSFGLHHLTDLLSEFLDAHPAIELLLDLNDREVNLVEEGFDLAVRIGALRDSTLVARRIGTARFVTCASPDYLRRHGTPSHPTELERHVGLHYTNVTLGQAWQFDTGERRPLEAVPGIRMRANNGDALAAAACAGLGIVNMPTFIVADHIARGELVPILVAFRRAPMGIYAMFPAGRLLPRRVQAVTDFLAARLGDAPAWDRVLED